MRGSALSHRFPIVSKLPILLFLALPAALPSWAQDKVEFFGGYSYLRASVQVGQFGPLGPGTPCPPNCGTPPRITQHANLNGWEVSGQYKMLPFLGAVVDFNGNYGTLDGAGTRVHTFLFGPEVSLPAKVSPFAHALFGLAKESQDAIPIVCIQVTPVCPGRFSLVSDTSFATAVGAGFDIKLATFVKLRLFQVDYVRTQLHGATQNQARASAGFVFYF